MKQIALWLAIAGLAMTGLAMTAASAPALAQRAHGVAVHPPVVHRGPGFDRRPPLAERDRPGFDRRRRRGEYDNFGAGWPVFMTPAAQPAPEIVTQQFIDPRIFIPRVPSVTVLSDEPVVFREPPHIIEFGRKKHRHSIVVVRRGVISLE